MRGFYSIISYNICLQEKLFQNIAIHFLLTVIKRTSRYYLSALKTKMIKGNAEIDFRLKNR